MRRRTDGLMDLTDTLNKYTRLKIHMKCAIWDRAYDREYSSMFPLIFFLAELFSIGRTFGRTPPEQKYSVTLYFKVSLLQCNYIFKYRVILSNYMYLL